MKAGALGFFGVVLLSGVIGLPLVGADVCGGKAFTVRRSCKKCHVKG